MTTSNLELHPVPCAICGTDEQCVELYSANFTPDAFNPAIFSARRLPDRIHYRMVRCTRCGLVRADPVADPTLLAQLYAQSTFEYGDETANLQWSYGSYLDRLTPAGAQPHTLLEIGCGNGFFLEEAERRGYVVHGVEPSTKACAQAPEHLRARICNDIMRPGLFPPASFDAICLFQVIDHISDPAALVETCFELLKPQGQLLCLTHNIGAFSARLLGERSPIVDIEHTFLFDQQTIAALFTAHGFAVETVGDAVNRYSLHYLTRLLPFPTGVKQRALALLRALRLDRRAARAKLGNLFIIARKPGIITTDP